MCKEHTVKNKPYQTKLNQVSLNWPSIVVNLSYKQQKVKAKVSIKNIYFKVPHSLGILGLTII